MTNRVTETTATISWDPVRAAIDKYVVRYTSADGKTKEIPVPKEQSSTIVTGLKPSTAYTVQVWAAKGSRESQKAHTKALTGTVGPVQGSPSDLSRVNPPLCLGQGGQQEGFLLHLKILLQMSFTCLLRSDLV